VTVMAIHEHEVDHIGMMNGLSAACYSIMASLLSFVLGVLANAAFTDVWPPESRILVYVVAPICGVLAVVFLVAGIVAGAHRKSVLTRIKQQSITEL